MKTLELTALKQRISDCFEGQADLERCEELKKEILTKIENSPSTVSESLRAQLDDLRSHPFCQQWFGLWATHTIWLIRDREGEQLRPKTASQEQYDAKSAP